MQNIDRLLVCFFPFLPLIILTLGPVSRETANLTGKIKTT